MPLKEGTSEATKDSNFEELYDANKDKPPRKRRKRKQIIAIVLSKARESMKKGDQ